KKAIALENTPGRLGQLGDVYARWGKRQQAHAVIQQLVAGSKQSHVSPMLIASIHARLGEKESALKWLERAQASDDPPIADSAFDSLRSDSRFKMLEVQLKPNQSCPEGF